MLHSWKNRQYFIYISLYIEDIHEPYSRVFCLKILFLKIFYNTFNFNDNKNIHNEIKEACISENLKVLQYSMYS